MCKSCIHQFNGKFCQQCEYCGHPAHEGNYCGVGVIGEYQTLDGKLHFQGCKCKEERYERRNNYG